MMKNGEGALPYLQDFLRAPMYIRPVRSVLVNDPGQDVHIRAHLSPSTIICNVT